MLKLDYQGWKKVGRRMSRESKKFRSSVKLSRRVDLAVHPGTKRNFNYGQTTL